MLQTSYKRFDVQIKVLQALQDNKSMLHTDSKPIDGDYRRMVIHRVPEECQNLLNKQSPIEASALAFQTNTCDILEIYIDGQMKYKAEYFRECDVYVDFKTQTYIYIQLLNIVVYSAYHRLVCVCVYILNKYI
jgi:hypothetical protein